MKATYAALLLITLPALAYAADAGTANAPASNKPPVSTMTQADCASLSVRRSAYSAKEYSQRKAYCQKLQSATTATTY